MVSGKSPRLPFQRTPSESSWSSTRLKLATSGLPFPNSGTYWSWLFTTYKGKTTYGINLGDAQRNMHWFPLIWWIESRLRIWSLISKSTSHPNYPQRCKNFSRSSPMWPFWRKWSRSQSLVRFWYKGQSDKIFRPDHQTLWPICQISARKGPQSAVRHSRPDNRLQRSQNRSNG